MKKYRNLIIIFLLILLGFVIAQTPIAKGVKSFFLRMSSPIIKVFNLSGNTGSHFFRSLGEISNLSKDLTKAQNENLQLKAEIAKLQEVSHENEILKKELGFISKEENKKYIPAKVISRPPTGYLQYLMIDKGKADGVKEGQALISNGYLVGRVSQVYAKNSEIYLINNQNSLIPVILEKSRGTGLLRGGLKGLTVEEISLDTKISEGESVITSGLAGEYSNGILIGTVGKKISAESEIFQKVNLSSPIIFSQLEIILVVVE